MADTNVPLVESPDTKRTQRIPPRQALTRKWPVLHAGTCLLYTSDAADE